MTLWRHSPKSRMSQIYAGVDTSWPCSPAGGSQRRDKRGSGVLLGPSLVGCALSLDLFLINEPLNTYCNLLYCTFWSGS